jgi:NADPH2:quinone reductase
MQALVYNVADGEFKVTEVPIPDPEPHEIRVKCIATSLNPVDAKIENWKGMLEAIGVETIHLGLDVCGLVDAVGSEVTTIRVGNIVVYHGNMKKKYGGFAEYAIHDALTTVVVADNADSIESLDPLALAGSPCAAWTAHRALYDKLRVPKVVTDPDSSIAIIGASGGVGTFALQFSKISGFQRIIAVCSKKNEEYVRSLGATDVIDYRMESSIHEAIQRVTNNEGIDYVLGMSLDYPSLRLNNQ